MEWYKSYWQQQYSSRHNRVIYIQNQLFILLDLFEQVNIHDHSFAMIMIKRLIIIEFILLSISNEVHHTLIIHDGRQLCAMSCLYNAKWLIVLFVIILLSELKNTQTCARTCIIVYYLTIVTNLIPLQALCLFAGLISYRFLDYSWWHLMWRLI